jgi:uncharacterized protein (TIGR03083 family)
MRLQAHETAIHRTDAQSAFGRPDPIAPELARDAIGGLLTWFIPHGRTRTLLPCRNKALRFEEAGGESIWQLRIDDATAQLEAAAGSPDVTVRGDVSDLALYLWQRTGLERLQVEGERELAERYKELLPLP